MQERFLVLGKAGSGKTHLVLRKFLRFVEQHREDSVIFILPNNSQVEHLRNHILRTSGTKGYLDSGLVTFSGLANRILDNFENTPCNKLLNESEKDLVLSNILKDTDTDYFSEVSDYAGFKSALLSFVREIKENSLDPSSFKNVLKTIQSNKKHSPLNLKCSEFVTLYKSYQQSLNQNGLIDKEDLLTQAISHINNDLFPGVELLLIDGFHDYTQLELKFLKKLTPLIPNIYITLPLQTTGPVQPAFQTAHKTYSGLSGLGLQEMKLDENKRTRCQMLRHIEENIFTGSDGSVLSNPDYSNSPFVITAAANIQDEVEQIARRIKKLTCRGGYSFSQITVIFRNIEKYQDLVEDIFTRFCIPVRIYGKTPLKGNPLIKTILNTTKIFRYKWQDEAVWKVLKSRTGLEKDLINKLEHEYIKNGIIDDYSKWLNFTSIPELKPVCNLLKQLKKIFNSFEGRNSFSFYCKYYADIVKLFYGPSFKPNNKTGDKDNSSTVTGSYNSEIFDFMRSDAAALKEFLAILSNTTLDELSNVAGGLTFEEFDHILESQVALTSYKKTDRRKEVVNVINVLEARQWEMPVVFVGGLLGKEFPRQIREDLFLKDFYRRRLNATGRIKMREAYEQIDEERYLFYIAITRAKEKLFISYPSANNNGNLTLPSFFLSDIKKLFSKDIIQKIAIQRNLSMIIPGPEDIITTADSRNFVYYHLNTPCVSEREQFEEDTALWLYNNSENETSFRKKLCTLKGLIGSYNNLNLKFSDKRIIKKISETSKIFSPTKLKDYAQCPYKYFGRSTLKLKQTIPKSMDLLMQGTIIHKVLEEFFKDTQDNKNITKIFDDVFTHKSRGMVIGFEELKVRNEMLNTLLAFETEERKTAKTIFKPSMFEVKFGNEEIESLKIDDGENDYIEITGKVDRVDISEVDGKKVGIIIDYKYGQTEFKLADLEDGLDLQLPIYILALKDAFKIAPIAGEFYALKTSKKTGIYNQELIDNLNLNIKPSKKSLSVDSRKLNELLQDTKNFVLEFSKEIQNGRIELDPRNIDYCGEGNCDFANVCRIDKWRLR